jgi:hypothetical protein
MTRGLPLAAFADHAETDEGRDGSGVARNRVLGAGNRKRLTQPKVRSTSQRL